MSVITSSLSMMDISDPEIQVSPLSVTKNGTYAAPLGSAYSPVTVNVPTGAEIISKSDWDALSTAQKQAKGLVAIQETNSGYDRGELVNGADYIPLNEYIPYSNESDVLCSAHENMFNSTKTYWGDGIYPVLYGGRIPAYDSSENAVVLNARSDGIFGYVDKHDESDFTAYVVMRGTLISNYGRLISCMKSRSAGYGMMLFGNTIQITSWASDTSTGVSSSNYFVGAIKFSSSASAGYVYDSANDNLIKVAKSPSYCGQYVCLGTTDTTNSGGNSEPADVNVKYFAVVDGAETDEVIEDNIMNLYNEFLAE